MRLAPLDPCEQIGVDGELHYMMRPWRVRKLGIDDFVAPRAEVRGRRDAAQEVGVTVPGLAEERRLVDDVRSPRHLRLRRPHAFFYRKPLRDFCDGEPLLTQALDIGAFMLQSFLL